MAQGAGQVSTAGVLVTNGVWQLGTHITPQQLLAECSDGAYTTALTLPTMEVVDWELHLARLAR
jgi:hypothetical protein